MGAIEEHDGVAACDVEGERGIELDALIGEIGGGAGGRRLESRRADDETLRFGVDGGDGVGGAIP